MSNPENRVFCGDMDAEAYGKYFSDGFVTMPPANSPEYIDAVIQNAVNFNAGVILPITTAELHPLSENAKLLNNHGLQIAISPAGAINIVNNKESLYRYLESQNLPCVKFLSVNTKSAFFEALPELGFPENPVIMKPAVGNGSRGFRIIKPALEIQPEYFNTKAGSFITSAEALKFELPDNFDFTILVCEYLPGTEYSADMLVSEGKTLFCAIRTRKKTVSGISIKGEFIQSPEIEELARFLAQKLDLHGPIGMQFKQNNTGKPMMLEVNPRLQGAVSSVRKLGVNIPLLSVQLAMGEIPEINRITPTNFVFNRFWKDILDD